MGENTKISWASHTFNPWIGCTKVSDGCKFCYAESLDRRWGRKSWGPGAPRRRTSEANWKKPLAWNRQAQGVSPRPRVFCASLADIFDHEAPPGALDDLWELVRLTPNLDWLLLTKRPERIDLGILGEGTLPVTWPDPELERSHVWLGISAEDQETLNERWPELVAATFRHPPAVRFVSYEPALGPLDLEEACCAPNHEPMYPDWLIVGGESGPGARPMKPEWVDDIIRQCHRHGVAVWFKQWGTAGGRPNDATKGGEHVHGRLIQEVPAVREAW